MLRGQKKKSIALTIFLLYNFVRMLVSLFACTGFAGGKMEKKKKQKTVSLLNVCKTNRHFNKKDKKQNIGFKKKKKSF